MKRSRVVVSALIAWFVAVSLPLPAFADEAGMSSGAMVSTGSVPVDDSALAEASTARNDDKNMTDAQISASAASTESAAQDSPSVPLPGASIATPQNAEGGGASLADDPVMDADSSMKDGHSVAEGITVDADEISVDGSGAKAAPASEDNADASNIADSVDDENAADAAPTSKPAQAKTRAADEQMWGTCTWELVDGYDGYKLRIYSTIPDPSKPEGSDAVLPCEIPARVPEDVEEDASEYPRPWEDDVDSIEILALDDSVVLPEDSRYLFSGMSSLTNVQSAADGTKITDMSYMFSECSELSSVSGVAWSKMGSKGGVNIDHFFEDCNLTSLAGMEDFTAPVTSMNYAFANCGNLKDSSAMKYWDLSGIPWGDGSDYNGWPGVEEHLHHPFEGCYGFSEDDARVGIPGSDSGLKLVYALYMYGDNMAISEDFPAFVSGDEYTWPGCGGANWERTYHVMREREKLADSEENLNYPVLTYGFGAGREYVKGTLDICIANANLTIKKDESVTGDPGGASEQTFDFTIRLQHYSREYPSWGSDSCKQKRDDEGNLQCVYEDTYVPLKAEFNATFIDSKGSSKATMIEFTPNGDWGEAVVSLKPGESIRIANMEFLQYWEGTVFDGTNTKNYVRSAWYYEVEETPAEDYELESAKYTPSTTQSDQWQSNTEYEWDQQPAANTGKHIINASEDTNVDDGYTEYSYVAKNKYVNQPKTAWAEIKAEKWIDGHDPKDRTFQFEACPTDSKYGECVQVENDNREITFHLEYEQNETTPFDEPTTIEYTVREIRGSEESVIYDTHEYTVTVQVSYRADRDVLMAWVDQSTLPVGGIVFDNYTKATGKAQISATKRFKQGDETLTLTKDQFTFNLCRLDDGQCVEETTVSATNDANGNVTFPDLEFEATEEEPYAQKVVYTYRLSEVAGDDADIVYDTQTHDVTVSVSRDAHDNTKLNAVVKYGTDDSVTFVNTKREPGVILPYTGGSGKERLASLLAGLAMLVCAATVIGILQRRGAALYGER